MQRARISLLYPFSLTMNNFLLTDKTNFHVLDLLLCMMSWMTQRFSGAIRWYITEVLYFRLYLFFFVVYFHRARECLTGVFSFQLWMLDTSKQRLIKKTSQWYLGLYWMFQVARKERTTYIYIIEIIFDLTLLVFSFGDVFLYIVDI